MDDNNMMCTEAERDGHDQLIPRSDISAVQPVSVTTNRTLSSDEQQLSDSLSLLKDTLPGFKSTPSPAMEDTQDKEEQFVETHKEVSRTMPALETPDQNFSLVVTRDESSDSSDIDEDALSIIIAVEGEDDDEDDNEREEEMQVSSDALPSLTMSTSSQLSPKVKMIRDKMDRTIDLTSSSSYTDQPSATTENRSTTGNSDGDRSSPRKDPPATNKSSDGSTAAQHSKQSAKIKQFFTTLQTFGNKTSQEVAEQVQELITALVNDLVTVEEFHQEIQKVTNHPLKEFVVPFLKENLAYFREELKSTSLVLSDILGTAPKSNAPAVAPEISERDLVVVHSTKPSTPCMTTTIMTTPTSPLRAPANLTSMSVPPATIHEPQLVSPTRIESVINASLISNNRKRPRDLMMGNGGDDRDSNVQQRIPKRLRPIPTATLTPEPPISSVSPQTHHTHSAHHTSSTHHTPSAHHTPSMHHSSLSHTHTHPHPHHTPTTGYQFTYNSKGTPTVTTPITTDIPTGVAMVSTTDNHRMALINQVKEDWNHLETMLVSVEGMVVKTQKALSLLKERIQQIGLGPSPAQMKACETEIEQRLQKKMDKTLEEVQHQAAEDKQRILLDATKQMRDTLREMNAQSSSKESCWNCGRKATETCSGCNKARYCGTFCQHRDWDRHMKQCAGARQEKERPPVQIVAATHNPVPTKQPTHYITSPAHQPGPTGPCYIRTSSRTPTPTSYPTVSEVYFPLHTDSMTNGSNNNALTASSTTGVAVVTINRTPGDLTPSGVNIL